MDQQEIVTSIIDTIGNACPVPEGMYSLYVTNSHIGLFPDGMSPLDSWLLARLDHNEVNYGLRVEKWDRIEERINTLRKAGRL